MNSEQARDAVNGAAIVVAGIYFYRKLIEPGLAGSTAVSANGVPTTVPVSLTEPKSIGGAAAQLLGKGPVASTGRFVVGFGFTFLVLSLMEGASPELAGNFALLIALGSVLGNGLQVSKDVSAQLDEKQRSVSAALGGASPTTPTVQVAAWEPASQPLTRTTSTAGRSRTKVSA